MEYKIPYNARILDINPGYREKYTHYIMEGLYINTDKGVIKILIDNLLQYEEDAGALFLETPDDISKFVGAKILKIEDVCIGLTAREHHECGDESQLKIVTNKGVLQYAVYNVHNGYYSHAVFKQVFTNTEEGYI